MLHGQAGRGSARVLTLLLGFVTLSGAQCFSKGPKFTDAGTDAGVDAGTPPDAGVDGGHDAGPADAGDAGVDAGVDAGIDAGPEDAGIDGGFEIIDGGIDGGPDAGPPDGGIDAGPPDGGIDAGPPDGGPHCDPFTEVPPNTGFTSNAGLGDPCDMTMDPPTPEQNCGAGLECLQMVPGKVAFCTTLGSGSGFGCGPNNSGYYVSGSPNMCLATCDATHPCPQNLSCNHNVCLPDCRIEPPTYCLLQFGDHTMCNQGNGICETKSCSTSNDCPANGTCDTSTHTCFFDCNANSNYCCHLGPDQLCNPSTNRCSPGAPYLATGNDLVLPMISLDAGTDGGLDAGPDCTTECGVIDGGIAGPDGGPDTTPYDGGPLTDAGRPANATNAMPCSPSSPIGSSAPQQGTCAAQHTCVSLDVAGFCSQNCTTDNQCEANNGLAGVCNTEKGSCILRCDATHACPQGAACQDLGGATVCLPDCRREWPDYCHTYVSNGTTCSQSDGVCRQINCPATACPSGSVCDTTRTPSVCRVNCTPQPRGFCWDYMREEGPWCRASGICTQ